MALVGVVVACGGLTLSRRSLDAYAGAVCSDGTPAAYYFSKGSESSSTWLIMLQGGGWCWDADSCARRCGDGNPVMCSSREFESTLIKGGVFDSRLPELTTAHKAFVRYCTSDAHMGNGSRFGLQFRGAVVVRAVVADLVRTHGLSAGATILFGGASAGGRGAMLHLDRVASYVATALGDAMMAPVQVYGLLDSPMWIDMQPASGSSFPGFANVTRMVHANAAVDVDADCAAVYRGAEEWKCMFGEYRLPLLRAPYAVIASQHDSYQLDNDLPTGAPRNAAERAYVAAFGARVATLSQALLAAPPEPRTVYSSRCHRHAESFSATFFSSACLGASMEEALAVVLANVSRGYIDTSSCDADCFECSCCPQTRAEILVSFLPLAISLTALALASGFFCCTRRGRACAHRSRKRCMERLRCPVRINSSASLAMLANAQQDVVGGTVQ